MRTHTYFTSRSHFLLWLIHHIQIWWVAVPGVVMCCRIKKKYWYARGTSSVMTLSPTGCIVCMREIEIVLNINPWEQNPSPGRIGHFVVLFEFYQQTSRLCNKWLIKTLWKQKDCSWHNPFGHENALDAEFPLQVPLSMMSSPFDESALSVPFFTCDMFFCRSSEDIDGLAICSLCRSLPVSLLPPDLLFFFLFFWNVLRGANDIGRMMSTAFHFFVSKNVKFKSRLLQSRFSRHTSMVSKVKAQLVVACIIHLWFLFPAVIWKWGKFSYSVKGNSCPST